MFSKNASIVVICLAVILMNACTSTKDSVSVTEPVNPKDNPNSIENVLSDDDKDGVPNYLDREKDSAAGAIVNTHGETLDSDGDGIPDYLDKESYSAYGSIVNAEGVSLVPNQFITKEELLKLEKERNWDNKEMPTPSCACRNKEINYLPTLIFKVGSYQVSDHHIVALEHIAHVLQENPELSIVVEGHANGIGNEKNNLVLSYNRAKSIINFLVEKHGIDNSRLALRYKGEAQPLNGAAADLAVNCRVELRVNKGGELAMSKPAK